MNFSGSVAGSLVSLLVGVTIGAGVMGAYFVSTRYGERALNGSLKQKLIAHGLTIAAVLGAYAVILFGARAIRLYTGQTLVEALIFNASIAGTIILAKIKFRK
jgi:hypothetical protein